MLGFAFSTLVTFPIFRFQVIRKVIYILFDITCRTQFHVQNTSYVAEKSTDDGIRTHTRQILSLLPLPIALHRHYICTLDWTRTSTLHLLRVSPLPIALQGHWCCYQDSNLDLHTQRNGALPVKL